jgi:rod shape determining protein RodA
MIKMRRSNKELDNLEKEKIRARFDFILFFSVLLVSLFGVLMIYSATRFSMPGGVSDPLYYLKKQALWLAVSVVFLLLIQFINYRSIKKYWWVVFAGIIASLVLVLFLGFEVHGSKSWIDLKFFSVQPSEISKIFMVIVISAILSKQKIEKKNEVGFRKVFFSLVVLSVCAALVAMEPDLGTALIYYLTYVGMLFISGASILYFLGIIAATAGGVLLGLKINLIKEYQLDRILVFIKPGVQKEGAGYNLFQSKLAIGSGELFGKGLFLGKQTNLNYVPEHHTDFIFSVIGEELGFVGALIVIVLLTVIVWRCFYISLNASDSFGSLVSGGIGFMILSQVVINIGMTIGIMPIIGIPLPFLSYGGSNLLSVFAGIGLVENIYRRREMRKDYEIAYQEFD